MTLNAMNRLCWSMANHFDDSSVSHFGWLTGVGKCPNSISTNKKGNIICNKDSSPVMFNIPFSRDIQWHLPTQGETILNLNQAVNTQEYSLDYPILLASTGKARLPWASVESLRAPWPRARCGQAWPLGKAKNGWIVPEKLTLSIYIYIYTSHYISHPKKRTALIYFYQLVSSIDKSSTARESCWEQT